MPPTTIIARSGPTPCSPGRSGRAWPVVCSPRIRSGRELPELGAGDLLLTGIATHKVSRLITKDKITATLRAPFTRFQEKTGHGEVEEAARGRGLRYAIGELLVCPYCIAQWVAGGFTLGYVFAPRTTRLLASMWTAHAIADAAQLAYSAAENRS